MKLANTDYKPNIQVRTFLATHKTQMLDLAIHARLCGGTVIVADKECSKAQELIGDNVKVLNLNKLDVHKLDGLLLVAQPADKVSLFKYDLLMRYVNRFNGSITCIE